MASCLRTDQNLSKFLLPGDTNLGTLMVVIAMWIGGSWSTSYVLKADTSMLAALTEITGISNPEA